MTSNEYVAQVLDFHRHLHDMDITADADERHIAAFYDYDWKIEINGKLVIVNNEADFYYGMIELLERYIALSL